MSKLTTALGDFAFLAVQAAAPFTETLQWATDITPSRSGGEERISLLKRARQSFSVQYPVRFANGPDAFNSLYGALAAAWLVPVWSEAQYAGTLAAGATGAAVGNAAADLRVGGLALLWGTGATWAVVQVTSVSAGAVGFAALGTAVTSAFVVPLRTGRISGTPQRRTSGYDARWALTYEVDDTVDLAPAAPAQYLGDDIYYDETLAADGDGMTESLAQAIDVTDYDIGVVAQSTAWANPRVSRPHTIFTNTLADAWTYRQFLHRRAGRARAFWQPSFLCDMRVTHVGAVGASLLVARDSWDTLGLNRTHVAIETASGWQPRAITGAFLAGASVQLTLDNTLGGIDASTIQRVSYLALRRLDTDSVQLEWLGGGCCRSSVRTVELTP